MSTTSRNEPHSSSGGTSRSDVLRKAILTVGVVSVLALAPAGSADAVRAAAPAASVASATCTTVWGSGTQSRARTADAELVDVRTGRHTCFDRLVVDLDGPAVGYRVRYVTQVRQAGSGTPVSLRGLADLQITVTAPAYDGDGTPTYDPAKPSELTSVSGYRTFRQVAWAGSFEGQTTIGLGVRARLPFRVQTVTSGGVARIVVDVAHTW